MALKNWLKISIALHILTVFFFVGKRLYYSRFEIAPSLKTSTGDKYNDLFNSIYNNLAIDSTDIVLLGTSITQAFPGELLGPEYKNRGIGHNTTVHMLGRLDKIKRAKRIFIEAGINDFIVDKRSVNETFENCKKILAILKGKCVVQSMFPVSGEYSIYSDSVSRLDAKLREYCYRQKIDFLDLSVAVKNMGSQFSVDGVHPNGVVYRMWATSIEGYVAQLNSPSLPPQKEKP